MQVAAASAGDSPEVAAPSTSSSAPRDIGRSASPWPVAPARPARSCAFTRSKPGIARTRQPRQPENRPVRAGETGQISLDRAGLTASHWRPSSRWAEAPSAMTAKLPPHCGEIFRSTRRPGRRCSGWPAQARPSSEQRRHCAQTRRARQIPKPRRPSGPSRCRTRTPAGNPIPQADSIAVLREPIKHHLRTRVKGRNSRMRCQNAIRSAQFLRPRPHSPPVRPSLRRRPLRIRPIHHPHHRLLRTRRLLRRPPPLRTLEAPHRSTRRPSS